MGELTPAQANGLAAIEQLIKSKGVPPRLCEIQSRLGYKSVSSVQNILRGLKAAKKITWRPGSARSIRIIGQDSKILEFDDRQYQDCTQKQQGVLRAIVELTNEQQRPPSVREVRDRAGLLGMQNLQDELKTLRAKRFVTWLRGEARTLRVLELAANVHQSTPP